MTLRRLIAPLGLAALMVSAVASSGHATPARAEYIGVEMVEPAAFDPSTWGFGPNSTIVQVGDTITWTNRGNAPHNAVAYDGTFESPILFTGESWSFTVENPGVYDYNCKLHPDMRASLIVLG